MDPKITWVHLVAPFTVAVPASSAQPFGKTLYRIDVYDTNGIRQKIITDFTSLSFTKRVNAPGILHFTLRGDHSLLSIFGDKWQYEVWRKPYGSDWIREIVGLGRSDQWSYKGLSEYEGVFPGLMSILGWRHIFWYADTNNRSTFNDVVGETLMKTLVNYNATSLATTGNGRLRNGAITGLSVEADGAHGNILDWNCAYDNLLVTLQKIALVAGGDFDLVKTSPTTWQFRWYTGQLGTDRTSTVKFSLDLGNMGDPSYDSNRIEEKTVALVGGKGEGSSRAIAVRTGLNYNVSTNNIETFVNATNAGTTAALNSSGDSRLRETQAKRDFGFKVLQAPATMYGVHYQMGDLVTAINPFSGDSYVQKVWGVTVTLREDGTESVEIDLGAE